MKKWAILYPFVAIALLLWIEQGLDMTYVWKTAAKIILFLAVPILFLNDSKFEFLHMKKIQRNRIILAIGLGIAVMVTIISAFMLLKNSIDLPSLQMDLETRVGVTATVFPFVSFYILIGNSFLEEFFFRGLLVNLFKISKLQWILPSFLFAIYHIAIFLPWFEWPILMLAVGGLWIGGLIFQWVNKECGTLYPSWIIHIFADIGVLLVGVYIFYFQ